jgi:hypothetical protein
MQGTGNNLSRCSFFVCLVAMCYTGFFFYPRWQQRNSESTISWDVSGYYWYLPSLFIYNDIKHQSFKDSIISGYQPTNSNFQQANKVENGNYVMKYPSGMALMYLPFFVTAHFAAGLMGYAKDGFSPPYQFSIQLGGFLVSILGLSYFRKLLLYYYRDNVVAVVLILLVAGTNYLEYTAIDNGMSHTWLFTIYVFLLLNTHYFYRSFRAKYAIRIGMLVGLATLTRFTDIISCLLPLLWTIESISATAVKKQFALFVTHFKSFAIAAFCALMIISIQLIYWKYVSGHWFVYSYGDQGFSFRHPNFRPYTFSYRSGWLIYTPLMIFSFIGIIPFLKNGKNKLAIITFFALNYYIVCSWDIWYYGGRAMIQSYPVLFFPVAALADAAFRRRTIAFIFAPFALLFIYMNIWITYHYHKGSLYDSDFMTRPYFWRVAGRWSAPESTLVLRDNTELFEGQPRHVQLIYQNDFENDSGSFYTNLAITGNTSLLVKGWQITPRISIPFSGKGVQWIRVQATFRSASKEWYGWNMTQFIVKLKEKDELDSNKSAKYNMLRVNRVLNEGETRIISLDMKLPSAHYDSLQIWFKNTLSDKQLIVDDLKVYGFTE